MSEIYYSKAVNEALDEELARDPNVIMIGEDIGCYGGAFGVSKGLWEKYGPERLWETPISEGSITGIAIGAAMMGLKPVLEIMFMDFVALALDQMMNSAGKLHSTASQVKGLLKAAIRDPNPVVFIENKRLYPQKGEVPEGDYVLPLDKAVVMSPGKDMTLISYSSMTPVCMAVKKAFEPHGIDIEVVDLVSLQPLDTETIFASVRKTGHVIIVEEACLTGGVGGEVSALIAEHCLDALEAPVMRVGAADVPIPSSVDLEKMVLPQADDVVNAVKKMHEWQ